MNTRFGPLLSIALLTGSFLLPAVNASADCVAPPPGLVGWWPGEGDAKDVVGGNDGVLVGGTTFSSGIVGQAFSFDGISDSVTNAVPGLTNILDTYTMEFWAWPTAGRDTTAEDTSGIYGNSNQRYAIFPDNGKFGAVGSGVSVGTNGVSVFELGSAYLPALLVYDTVITNWTHVAVVYSSQQPSLYLNGVLVRTGLVSSRSSYPSTCLGDAANLGFGFYAGLLDEVSIYNRALTSAEIAGIFNAGSAGKCPLPVPPFIVTQPTNQTVITGSTATFVVTAGGSLPLSYQWTFFGTNLPGQTGTSLTLANVQSNQSGLYAVQVTNAYGITNSSAILTVSPAPPCYVAPSGLVAWYRGEGDGRDSVGPYMGILVGGTSFAAGEVGQAFAFDGIQTSVSNSVPGLTNVVSSYTMEFWALPTDSRPGTPEDTSGIAGTGNQRYAIFPHGAYPPGLVGSGVSLGTNGVSVFEHGNAYMPSLLVYDAPILGWTHIAVVYSSNQPSLYINGTFVHAGLVSSTPSCPSIILGGRIWSGLNYGFYSGLMDEVSIYNRALSPDEVQSIYNAGNAQKCPFPPFIVAQPTNRTAFIGSPTTFTFTAGGTSPLSYQWTFNGTNISGATSSSLSLPNIQFNQAGNYAVQVTNAAGLTNSTNATLSVIFPPTTVRVIGTNVRSGSVVTVPVTMAANGNENALAFSLSFDATKLTYAGVTLGAGATGGFLIPNTSATNTGKLGLSVALPYGTTFSAGTQEVARVSFASAVIFTPSVTASTISFGDQPTLRQLFDGQVNALPAGYSNGTVSISAATGYEGDVFPRSNGDTNVTLADWLMMGRYVARLAYPTNAAEFQRADCAPRATLGDGAIKVSDWVQVDRYVSGLDPLTPVGGPTNEIAGAGAGPSASRIVSAGSLSLVPGQTGAISINLAAQGNENAVGFTLTFDPTVVTLTGVNLGTDASGGTLIVNTNQAATGLLGCVLAVGTGNSFASGNRQLIQVNFRAVSAGGIFSPGFSDAVVPREISDPGANALPASYSNGSVIVNGNLSLRIGHAGTNIILAWPLWANTFTVQEASGNLVAPIGWTNLPIVPFNSNGESTVVLPWNRTNKYYRLWHP
jgi:hypothetical protein